MKNLFRLTLVMFFYSTFLNAQNSRSFEIKSPDGNIILALEAGTGLYWSVKHKGQTIIKPSVISLQLQSGEILGNNLKVKSSEKEEIRSEFKAINYKKSVIKDEYNQLTIEAINDFGIVFRVYDDAVAYRFFTRKKEGLVINNETANFNFVENFKAFIPYMGDNRKGKVFNCPFESLYTEHNISQFHSDSLAFLPILIDLGNNKKAAILEADLEDYPGMFLNLNETGKGFKGVFAPYPLKEEQDGIKFIPTQRADYIAKTSGTRNFPWRVLAISEADKELLNNDIVQKLASPCRLEDISWIKAGQVAWDWWNALNISRVDFRAGINTDTYKYFIDFASANNIPYIILDGGWSASGDLTKTKPQVNLPEIIDHGNKKGVDVILWASWHALVLQMDEVFELYSKMGIKGFKIDFFERDDQLAVASTYKIAEKAAKHHLLIDYHGIYKPTGLQRTYPNVVGYEGVKGMENVKWENEDVPRYDVTIPFIRMLAGPMDYTPGAMRNSNKANFWPVRSNPMSQGTRCHQLAMYVIYEVPLQMLSDNPTIYMQEQECTDFITSVPVFFDETFPLDGEVGEYVALARKKESTWFVGAMTNWDSRTLTIDFSFLDDGKYRAVIFKDGINADRDATDYKKEVIEIAKEDKLEIQLSTGGGWAARIEKLN